MGSARLAVSHSLGQRDLVYWKYERLWRLVRTPPRESPNPGYSATAMKVYFTTRCVPELRQLWEAFYAGGKKEVTNEALAGITDPIGLAVWYMDDGSRGHHSTLLRFHTEGYSRPSVVLLARWLLKEWGFKAYLLKRGKRKDGRRSYVLGMAAEEGAAFLRLIRGHIEQVPSMHSKILPEVPLLSCVFCQMSFQPTRRRWGQMLRRGTVLVICLAQECHRARQRAYWRLKNPRLGCMT